MYKCFGKHAPACVVGCDATHYNSAVVPSAWLCSDRPHAKYMLLKIFENIFPLILMNKKIIYFVYNPKVFGWLQSEAVWRTMQAGANLHHARLV
jgi:hypothetical protein